MIPLSVKCKKIVIPEFQLKAIFNRKTQRDTLIEVFLSGGFSQIADCPVHVRAHISHMRVLYTHFFEKVLRQLCFLSIHSSGVTSLVNQAERENTFG